jgi:hypothetical protein
MFLNDIWSHCSARNQNTVVGLDVVFFEKNSKFFAKIGFKKFRKNLSLFLKILLKIEILLARMNGLSQKQWLESTNCVVNYFSIFEFFEKIYLEKWTKRLGGIRGENRSNS